jgi:hypothetical protein
VASGLLSSVLPRLVSELQRLVGQLERLIEQFLDLLDPVPGFVGPVLSLLRIPWAASASSRAASAALWAR